MVNQHNARTSSLESRQQQLLQELRQLKQMHVETVRLKIKLQSSKIVNRRIDAELIVAKQLLLKLETQIECKQNELQLIDHQLDDLHSTNKNKSRLRTMVAMLLIFGLLMTPLLLSGVFGEMFGTDSFSITGAAISILSDNTKPLIDIDESSSVKSFGNVKINFSVSDNVLVDSAWVTLKDGGDTYEQESVEVNSASNNVIYIVEVPSIGVKQVRVSANDSSGNTRQTNWVNIERLEEIPLEEFFGSNTTNLTEQTDAYEIENFTLENEHGKIKWKNKLNLVNQDVASHVMITLQLITVESNALDSTFNSTADIILYNRTHIGTPQILKNETGEWLECVDCSNIEYYPELQEVHFTVPSFSSYTSIDGDELLIYDDSDVEGGLISRFAQQETGFFANYSNATFQPVISVGSYCEISNNDTGTWSAPLNMSYNSSSLLYETNKIYQNKGLYFYNISCYSDTQDLNLIDNITILNSLPNVPLLQAPLNESNITNRMPELLWLNSTDSDTADNLSYNLYVSNSSDFAVLTINTTIPEANALNSSFLITNDLDISSTYYWKVQATDGDAEGQWSNTFEFNVWTLVDVQLLVSNVDFGTLNPGASVNTTDANYTAMEITNLGNVPVTIDLKGTPFFTTDTSTGNYSFMIEEKELGAYLSALTSWTNMSETDVESIVQLYHVNNSNSANEAYIHLLVKIPTQETAGAKHSNITITSVMS